MGHGRVEPHHRREPGPVGRCALPHRGSRTARAGSLRPVRRRDAGERGEPGLHGGARGRPAALRLPRRRRRVRGGRAAAARARPADVGRPLARHAGREPTTTAAAGCTSTRRRGTTWRSSPGRTGRAADQPPGRRGTARGSAAGSPPYAEALVDAAGWPTCPPAGRPCPPAGRPCPPAGRPCPPQPPSTAESVVHTVEPTPHTPESAGLLALVVLHAVQPPGLQVQRLLDLLEPVAVAPLSRGDRR